MSNYIRNVALFRTCALFFLVASLNKFVDALVAYFGGYAEESSFSGAYVFAGIIPVVVCSLILAKKNALLLKIWAAIVVATYVISNIMYVVNLHSMGSFASDFRYAPFFIRSLLNTTLVLCGFSFVAGSCKNQQTDSSLNMDLLRLCAVFTLVFGLNVEASFFIESSLSIYEFMLWGVVPVIISIFSLIKKRTVALELFAVIYIIGYFIGGTSEFVDLVARDLDGKSGIIPWLLQCKFVVFGATFFIDREQNRGAVQKVKFLFGKAKKFT